MCSPFFSPVTFLTCLLRFFLSLKILYQHARLFLSCALITDEITGEKQKPCIRSLPLSSQWKFPGLCHCGNFYSFYLVLGSFSHSTKVCVKLVTLYQLGISSQAAKDGDVLICTNPMMTVFPNSNVLKVRLFTSKFLRLR